MKEECENYRVIFPSNQICKRFEKILFMKDGTVYWEKYVAEFQAEATRGRRSTNQIIISKTKIDYDKHLGQETCIHPILWCR